MRRSRSLHQMPAASRTRFPNHGSKRRFTVNWYPTTTMAFLTTRSSRDLAPLKYPLLSITPISCFIQRWWARCGHIDQVWARESRHSWVICRAWKLLNSERSITLRASKPANQVPTWGQLSTRAMLRSKKTRQQPNMIATWTRCIDLQGFTGGAIRPSTNL